MAARETDNPYRLPRFHVFSLIVGCNKGGEGRKRGGESYICQKRGDDSLNKVNEQCSSLHFLSCRFPGFILSLHPIAPPADLRVPDHSIWV